MTETRHSIRGVEYTAVNAREMQLVAMFKSAREVIGYHMICRASRVRLFTVYGPSRTTMASFQQRARGVSRQASRSAYPRAARRLLG